jgi:predicted transglutaminase-like cysteine proteinase
MSLRKSLSAKTSQLSIDFKINILDIKVADPDHAIMNHVYMISMRRHGQTLTTKSVAPTMLESFEEDGPNAVITFNESFDLDATMFMLPDGTYREKHASLTIQHREQNSKSAKSFVVDSEIKILFNVIYNDKMIAKKLEYPFVANDVKFKLDILVEMFPTSPKSLTSRIISTNSFRHSGSFTESTSIRSIHDLSDKSLSRDQSDQSLSPKNGQSVENFETKLDTDNALQTPDEPVVETVKPVEEVIPSTIPITAEEPAPEVVKDIADTTVLAVEEQPIKEKPVPVKEEPVHQVSPETDPEVAEAEVAPVLINTDDDEHNVVTSSSLDQTPIDDDTAVSSIPVTSSDESTTMTPSIEETASEQSPVEETSSPSQPVITASASAEETLVDQTPSPKKLAKRVYWNILLLILGYAIVILATIAANNENTLKDIRIATVKHASQHLQSIRAQINHAVKDMKAHEEKESKAAVPVNASNSKDLVIMKTVNQQLQRTNPIRRIGQLLNPLKLVGALWTGMMRLFGMKSK